MCKTTSKGLTSKSVRNGSYKNWYECSPKNEIEFDASLIQSLASSSSNI